MVQEASKQASALAGGMDCVFSVAVTWEGKITETAIQPQSVQGKQETVTQDGPYILGTEEEPTDFLAGQKKG